MPTATLTDPTPLRQDQEGVWLLDAWAPVGIRAGIRTYHGAPDDIGQARGAGPWVCAEQVHGSSVAVVERRVVPFQQVAGCDALLTGCEGVTLSIRTMDCLPVFVADPMHHVVALAHAGWRGLAAQLPLRLIAAMQHAARSQPDQLRVAIGPAIHACCYEVGKELEDPFGPFIEMRHGRRMCDLIAAATAQLVQAGVPARSIVDSGQCTACHPRSWCSLRRDGPGAGKNISFIRLETAREGKRERGRGKGAVRVGRNA